MTGTNIYHSAVHETTGYTPCELLLGRQIEVPLDILLGKPKPDESNGPADMSDFATNLQKLAVIYPMITISENIWYV